MCANKNNKPSTMVYGKPWVQIKFSSLVITLLRLFPKEACKINIHYFLVPFFVFSNFVFGLHMKKIRWNDIQTIKWKKVKMKWTERCFLWPILVANNFFSSLSSVCSILVQVTIIVCCFVGSLIINKPCEQVHLSWIVQLQNHQRAVLCFILSAHKRMW